MKLDRRQLLVLPTGILSGASALASPGPTWPRGGQTASLSTGRLTPELVSYVHAGLAASVTRIRLQGNQPADQLDAARKLKLMARHLENTGFDRAFREVLPSIDFGAVDLANPPGLAERLASMRQVDPSLTTADLVRTDITPGEVQEHVAYLRENGISQCFYNVAEALRQAAYSSSLVARAPLLAADSKHEGTGNARSDAPLAETDLEPFETPVLPGAHLFCDSKRETTLEKLCRWIENSLYLATLALALLVSFCAATDITALGLAPPVAVVVTGFCVSILAINTAVTGWSLTTIGTYSSLAITGFCKLV